MNTPTMSIIVPVYNVAPYVEQTCKCILRQMKSDDELLLIDDASSDRSADICESLVQKDSRVRFFQLGHNGGASAARNCGLKHATGELIFFHDADDELAPNALTRMRRRFSAGSPDLLLFNFAYKDEHSAIRDSWITQSFDRRPVIPRDEAIAELLESRLAWGVFTLCCRRRLLTESRTAFDPRLQVAEDLDLFFHLLVASHSVMLDSTVLYYHIIREHSLMSRATGQKHLADSIAQTQLVERGISQWIDENLPQQRNLYLRHHLRMLFPFFVTAWSQRQIDQRLDGLRRELAKEFQRIPWSVFLSSLPAKQKAEYVFVKLRLYRVRHLSERLSKYLSE